MDICNIKTCFNYLFIPEGYFLNYLVPNSRKTQKIASYVYKSGAVLYIMHACCGFLMDRDIGKRAYVSSVAGVVGD